MHRFLFLRGIRAFSTTSPYLRATTATTAKLPLTPLIKQVLNFEPGPITINGWVKSIRRQKNVVFLSLSDGSCLNSLQIVLSPSNSKGLGIGTCLEVSGELIKSPRIEQPVELVAENVTILGSCQLEALVPDEAGYPLQKQELPLVYLRDYPHLRARTRRIMSILQVRQSLESNFHRFFQNNEFLKVTTPIITGHDCEGAGQVFCLTTATETKETPFFATPAYLGVSGQLHLEAFAHAHPRVYLYAPAFRAEASKTNRHAAEFWMLEAELAFLSQLDPLLETVELMIKSVVNETKQKCAEELGYLNAPSFALGGFVRMTYQEALDQLNQAGGWGLNWGAGLKSEHENYLVQRVGGRPLFITHYPKQQKPFYMLPSSNAAPDRETVECFDLLVPRVAELVGGSLREHRLEMLGERMKYLPHNYQWYADLRRFGSARTGGFGLGMERMLMWVTGMENIRDVTTFPRWAEHCQG